MNTLLLNDNLVKLVEFLPIINILGTQNNNLQTHTIILNYLKNLEIFYKINLNKSKIISKRYGKAMVCKNNIMYSTTNNCFLFQLGT